MRDNKKEEIKTITTKEELYEYLIFNVYNIFVSYDGSLIATGDWSEDHAEFQYYIENGKYHVTSFETFYRNQPQRKVRQEFLLAIPELTKNIEKHKKEE